MTEQQREAFEAWYNEEYVRPIIPADRTEGGYQHPDAQAAWDAWQAALSHAEGEACQTCGGSGLLGERPTHQNPDDAHCEPCPDCADPAAQAAAQKISVLRGELVRERDYRLRAEAQVDYLKHRLGDEHASVWYWQGDGYDNLDSLVSSVTVAIRADDLRHLLGAPQVAVPEDRK